MPLHRSITKIMAASLLFSSNLLAAAEPVPPQANRAQVLVFMGEHLRQTQQGQVLTYDFARHESGEPDKADTVSMTIAKVHDDAKRDLTFQFLSGEDEIAFPDAHSYRGNPIAIQFLERDIRNMSRLTGKPSAYFRDRIRRAFRHPQVVDEAVDVGDQKVDATRVKVVPFIGDPTLEGIDGYAGKEYQFIYSEQVPGDLVEIKTRVARQDGTSLEEELRYHQPPADR